MADDISSANLRYREAFGGARGRQHRGGPPRPRHQHHGRRRLQATRERLGDRDPTFCDWLATLGTDIRIEAPPPVVIAQAVPTGYHGEIIRKSAVSGKSPLQRRHCRASRAQLMRRAFARRHELGHAKITGEQAQQTAPTNPGSLNNRQSPARRTRNSPREPLRQRRFPANASCIGKSSCYHDLASLRFPHGQSSTHHDS